MLACTWRYPFDLNYHEVSSPYDIVHEKMSFKMNSFVPELRGIMVAYNKDSLKITNKANEVIQRKSLVKQQPIIDLHTELNSIRVHVEVQAQIYRLVKGNCINVVVLNVYDKMYYCRSEEYKSVFVKISKNKDNLAESDEFVDPITLEKGMKISVKLKSVSIVGTRVKMGGLFMSVMEEEEEVKESKNFNEVKSVRLDAGDNNDSSDENTSPPPQPKKKEKKMKIDKDVLKNIKVEQQSEDENDSTQMDESTSAMICKKEKPSKNKRKHNEKELDIAKRIKLDPDAQDIWTDED